MKGKQHPGINGGLTKRKRRIIQKLLKIYKPYELNSRKQINTQVGQLTFFGADGNRPTPATGDVSTRLPLAVPRAKPQRPQRRSVS